MRAALAQGVSQARKRSPERAFTRRLRGPAAWQHAHHELKEITMLKEDLVVGTGEAAEAGKDVVVHYVGRLADGTQFDSSRARNEPLDFPLGEGQMIKGWEEGLPGMKVGGTRRLTIPPELAYGEAGRGDTIPPHATLVFEVELLEVA
jgi:FKBP-type peptidyl-prolyl cis-trans isomerase